MTSIRILALAGAAIAFASPTAAHAANEAMEVWLKQTVGTDIDKSNSLKLETGQRLRDADDKRFDTYLVRLWVKHKINKQVDFQAAVEHRENDGGADEVRLSQQVGASKGVLHGRVRFEQRWIEDAGRMGLRVRPRIGLYPALDKDKKWFALADAETFISIRKASAYDDEGLRAIKTRLGVQRQVSKQLSLRAFYVRKQVFKDDYPDKVAHAPQLGVHLWF